LEFGLLAEEPGYTLVHASRIAARTARGTKRGLLLGHDDEHPFD
jgi:hypothetical protein